MIINGYKLVTELTNANSGFSKWGFAVKNGEEYFIKELLDPVYPTDESVMSEALFEKQKNDCWNFERRFEQFYRIINEASRGNLVRINEFFRWNNKYYVVTEKVSGVSMSVGEISALPKESILLLLKSVAYAFFCLHSAGVVHFDVKPSNVLVKRTESGKYTAKVIDFDAGYTLDELKNKVEPGGDFTYLAPETLKVLYGEDVCLNEKADIFALGLLFHEYYCGKLPQFDRNEFDYACEAVLNEQKIEPEKFKLPDYLSALISSMLDVEPEKRPSAKEVLDILNSGGIVRKEEPEKKSGAEYGKWFKPLGDL